MTRYACRIIAMAMLAGMLAWLWPAAPADACSCAPTQPPQESLDRAKAVFAGKVKEIRKTRYGSQVLFDVSRTWKGVDKTQVRVATGMGDGDCGFPFTEGGEYLVYAHQDTYYGRSGGLATNICTRTNELSAAMEDLAALGAGAAPTRTVNLESTWFPWVLTAAVVLAMGLVVWLKLYRRRQE